MGPLIGRMARRRGAMSTAVPAILFLALLLIPHPIDARVALHASLLSSEPRAGEVLRGSPERIRLVFSEPLEPSMSAMAWSAAPPGAPALAATVDPRDVHALLARPGTLPAGAYTMGWRVVSADGHRVDGRIAFTILGAATDSGAPTLAVTHARDSSLSSAAITSNAANASSTASFGEDRRLSRATRALRATAVTSLLALAGLVLMIAILPLSGPRPMRLATILGVLTTVLLASYTVVWSLGVAAGVGAPVDAVMTATATTPGALEVARVALALLALWSIGLARRPGLAALFAVTGALITGASGHSAVILPYWSIPIKAMHMLGAALWLGGLLWLVTAERHGDRYLQGARRISSIALWAVLLVLASGIAQSALFLASPRALYESDFGRVVLLKIVGFLVLILFGAYHRRIVPRMDTTMARRRLRRSVRAEIAVMLVVSALGGILATIAPPR